ncbi:hypothetical protein BC834DRAFT_840969 [Gloeopeniophorella convolvens]|nr:hypothetical protein BC834DRAFT_840969 [Gloeopeniophorella convolvens]
MATINIGALLEYRRSQSVLRRPGALGLLDRNLTAIAAAIKVKLARRTQANEQMGIDGEDHRKSSDRRVGVLSGPQRHPSVPSALRGCLGELPLAFKMALKELTSAMLAHALKICPPPNPKRAPHVSSKYTQSDKVSSGSVLPEDWAVRGVPEVSDALEMRANSNALTDSEHLGKARGTTNDEDNKLASRSSECSASGGTASKRVSWHFVDGALGAQDGKVTRGG